jgi:hydroxylamine reductase
MFCRQCEQTQDHVACRSVGICGKTAETSAMQDGLVHTLKSMGLWCVAAREAGASAEEMYEANWWTLKSAFSTLTNVNFDEERIAEVSSCVSITELMLLF